MNGKRFKKIVLSMLCLVMVFSAAASAGTFPALKATTFARGEDKPVYVDAPFSVKNLFVPYILRVQNGGANGEFDRVSSAVMKINGATILDSGSFSQQVALIEKQVPVVLSNVLSLEIRSIPGSAMTVSIDGQDDTPPDLAIAHPIDGIYLSAPVVSVSGNASDSVSWIDAVTVNGVNATLSGDAYTAPNVALSAGLNTLTVTAVDAAGNSTSAVVSVYLDSIAPVVTLSPIPALTRYQVLSVSGTISDASPISSLTVNGIVVPVTEGAFTTTVTLAEGSNTINLAATDAAGNVGTASVDVVLDTTPPLITVLSPSDGAIVATDAVTINGAVDDASALVTVNGVSAPSSGSGFSASDVALVEGTNTISIVAVDPAGNSSSTILSVTYVKPDITPPTVIILSPAIGSVVNAASVTVTGTVDDPTAVVSVNGADVPVTAGAFTASISLVEGANTITVTASDAAGNTSTASTTVTCVLNHYPPDPVTVAPPLDTTTVPTLADATAFLYSGTNPIQTGVAPGTIEVVRAAVVRGSVVTPQGAPIPGVTITIMGHPEYGSTQSRADGAFDMAVNGGTTLTVSYAKDGYLPVHRQADVPWQDYVMAEDVVMIPYDSNVTAIDFSEPMQPARGSVISDSDGTRQATLLFPQNNWVTMVMPDGTTTTLNSVNVRATEYTVGPSGQAAMPAPLPPTSGYTYAVEFSVDEAVAVGAKMVRFSRPVISYNENFLGFPVGAIVPSGYYDREKGAWIPSDNGRVIGILGITSGLAEVDIDGSGIAADSTALASLGITSDELARLAALYQTGQSLWRVPVSHFTPWDFNFTVRAEDGAQRPNQPPAQADGPLPCESKQGGSIISCQSQILGEVLYVNGTPHTLNYRSNRTSGRIAGSSLRIYLSGEEVPSVLRRIELEIVVGGRKFAYTYSPEPNLIHTFTWDGKDAYGRPLLGRQTATIYIGYAYKGIYVAAAGGTGSAFGKASGITIGGVFGRPEAILWQTQKTNVTAWGSTGPVQGLGGWTFDIQHLYDPVGRVLYLGSGTERSASNFNRVISTVAGTGQVGSTGDGGLATLAKFYNPMGVAVDADGSYYIADTSASRIRKVGPDGIINTVAGTGQLGFSGDGGPATLAKISGVRDVALGPDGSIYLADLNNRRIRRVTPNGIIDTVAGNGGIGFGGDEGLATQATLYNPEGVAVSPDGSFYIADTQNSRIRKVSPDGIITTVAGTGTAGYSGDNGPATAAMLKRPEGVALGPDGSIYIVDTDNHRIRKIGTDGIITTVAGTGAGGFSGDGGFAVQAKLSYPRMCTVSPDGIIYISDAYNRRVRRITPDGVIATVVGNGTMGFSGDDGPATAAKVNYVYDISVGNDGSLYLADGSQRIRQVKMSSLPGIGSNDIAIASEGGSEAYIFNPSGRHLRTVDTATGANV
ncbi:MAG: hypothetical protein OEV28_04320, partial [Nitrospirota bacterium]|nr:hypothetical protein [Nitrospirota bacterium]